MAAQVFKGVKLNQNQVDYVQRIADKSFEGNFSMALRYLLSSIMAAKA